MIEQGDVTRGRILAIVLFLFEIGIMFAYGFGGYFFVETASTTISSYTVYNDYSSNIILYVFTAVLTILGYGLLISYSTDSAIAGLSTTLIVVAIGVQLGPLLQSFWTQVFTGFGPLAPLSLETERASMVMSTSLLVALTSLIGRLGALQTVFATFIFNFGWPLSYQVTQYIYKKYGPYPFPTYDDNGTNYVYVFAGFFGLVTSILLNCKPAKVNQTGSRHSAFIGLIGTGFIFATFPFTGILFPSTAVAITVRLYSSPLNIYFALTASVICTYIFSSIFGRKLKVGVRQSLLGVISGGVTLSVVSGSINNIGACIAIGAFSGFVSGFWLRIVHPRINATSSVDHLGLFGVVLVNAFLGGFVLAPSLYQSISNQGYATTGLGAAVTSSNVMKYQLVYFAVAAGTGIVAGLIAGIIGLIFRNDEYDFQFSKMVNTDFGLYRDQGSIIEAKGGKQGNETNNHLNNNEAL